MTFSPPFKPVNVFSPLAGMPVSLRNYDGYRSGIGHYHQEYYDCPLSKIEIKKFDGDPMNYWAFIRNFSAYVGKRCYSDDYRHQFLIQSLKPKVRDQFEHYPIMSPTEGFRGAWSQLYEDYGHPHMIYRRCEERLKDIARLREFDMESLNNFFILLNKCCTCLKSSPSYSTLDSTDVMLSVCDKLPGVLRYEWVKHSVQIERTAGEREKFADLTTFVRNQRRLLDSILGRAVHPPLRSKSSGKKYTSDKKERCIASSADTVISKSNPKKSERPCTFCGEPHFVANCKKFDALSYENRLNHVRSKVFCFKCLKGSHTSRDCRCGVKRGVKGCTGTLHHTLLHRSNVKLPTNKSSEGNAVSETCSAVRSSLSSVQFVFLNVVSVNVICGSYVAK